MDNITQKYADFLRDIFDETMAEEKENIIKAADLVAESCKQGGRFYVFGSGHSHMVAEEIYIRAGVLGLVKGILPPELMLHQMPNKSTYLERLEGYAKALINLYKVDDKDTLMVISNSGRNNVVVEMCLEAKNKGAKVISLSSNKNSQDITSRHPSGKKIADIADVAIDNHAPRGDAGFWIDGLDTPVGPTSDFIGIAIAQTLIVTVIEKLVKSGMDVPVFKSSNVDGADAYNDALFDKYYGYWK